MPPELFVEEDVVTVGGDLKFIRGIQGLKERRSQGSERWWRLACISFVFFFCLVLFYLPSADLPMGHPLLAQFSVSQWEVGGGREIYEPS